MKKILISKDSGYSSCVCVNINGVAYKVPVGVETIVPDEVYDVLLSAIDKPKKPAPAEAENEDYIRKSGDKMNGELLIEINTPGASALSVTDGSGKRKAQVFGDGSGIFQSLTIKDLEFAGVPKGNVLEMFKMLQEQIKELNIKIEHAGQPGVG